MGSSAAVRDKATAQILQSMFVLFLVMELIELIPIRIQDIYIYIYLPKLLSMLTESAERQVIPEC